MHDQLDVQLNIFTKMNRGREENEHSKAVFESQYGRKRNKLTTAGRQEFDKSNKVARNLLCSTFLYRASLRQHIMLDTSNF